MYQVCLFFRLPQVCFCNKLPTLRVFSIGVARVVHTIKLTWSPRQTQGSIEYRISFEDVIQHQRSRLGKCAVCDKNTHQMCKKCNIIRYCSRKCQLTDWQHHKIICDDMSKESHINDLIGLASLQL